MYIVALTGGIGSGKSEAAKQFAKLGVPVVDVDLISHALTAPGNPFLMEIERLFGKKVFHADKSLNRAALREHILANPPERLALEALIHPAIYDEALRQLHDNQQKLHPAYQLLVIPLLFENNRYRSIIDKALVVDCEEPLQIKRTMARSGLTEQEVNAMMAAQISRQDRLQQADFVIDNNGSKEELIDQVIKMHEKLIKTCIVSK